MFTEICMSVVASIIICAIILYLPIMNIDISKNWIVQILSMLVVILDELIILRAQKNLTLDWLRLDEMENEEYYAKKMDEFKAYNAQKEKRISFAFAIIPGVVGIAAIILKMEWVFAIALILTLVCMNQHLIGRRIATKRLSQNISSSFPKWLLDIALLLQSENVHVALRKSLDTVPKVLYKDLKEMIERLEIDPESSKPYHLFLKEFELPEIHSTVDMLYALSIGNSYDTNKQIKELISRNMKMLDAAETIRLRNKNSGMYLLFLAPVLTASLKLLIDMAVFLLTFLSVKTF